MTDMDTVADRAKMEMIVDRAKAGLWLQPDDVAALSLARRTVTLLHPWEESEDARVWSAVMASARHLARLACDTLGGRAVEIYSADGSLLDVVQ